MNTLRYFLALFLVITLPPLFLYWLLIHPFVNFWRGKGIGITYTMVLSVIVVAMIGLFSLRHFLLETDYGTNNLLVALGLLLLILSGSLRFAIHKHLGIKTLLGFPEIAPERFPRELITEGIYARMRHPRYVQLLIALIGYALIANYLAAYLAVALWVPGLYLIAVLEEKELHAHFGDTYDEYCRKVPRFLPKLRRDSGPIG
ncbi:MAG: isoprenylcysteine carboxylmethyltransferase family protein [Candidatus Binatia bacterium]